MNASEQTPQALPLRINMVWNSVGSIGRLVCNYLVTIIVVRLSHGFDAAGALALAMSIANLVNPFADFRLRTLQVTDVENERSSGSYVGLRVLTSLLAFVIGTVYAIATTRLDAMPVIVLYLVYSLATNFIEVFHAIDQRNRRMDFIGKSYLMQGVGTLAVFCLLIWSTNSLEIAVTAMGVVTLLICFLYDIPRAASFERIRPEFELGPAVSALTRLLPLVIAQVCSSAVLAIPRQHLAATLGTAALGIYSSVASPTLIVQMGATYVYSPLMGEFAETFYQDKRAAMRLLRKTLLAILVVTAMASLLLLVLGKPLLWVLFGQGIVEHVNLIQPAILSTVMTALAWFMNDLLLTLRDFKGSFIGNITAALVTLLVSSMLVDAFGMNGVSWVGVVSYGVAVAVMGGFLARAYRRLDS